MITDAGTYAVAVPAAVALDPKGAVLVGERAERYALHHPRRTVFSIKRLLGRKVYAPEVTWLAGAMPAELVPRDNGDASVHIGDRRVSPEELAAYVLRHVVHRLREQSGVEPERTVIATSAFFEVAQRNALMNAATIAGLEVRRFVESGAAAVLSLGLAPDVDRAAVVDLGGGYFDVSVMQRQATGWKLLASAGDALLGGDDLDRRILDHLVTSFLERHGSDLTQSASSLHRIRLAAREAKHQLTGTLSSHPIRVPMLAAVSDTRIDLEHPPMLRDELNKLWQDELESLWPPCVQLFDDLGLGTEDLDELILLGGTLEIPSVRKVFAGLFRTEGSRPDGWAGLAAHGAAKMARRAGRGDELIQSTLPHTLSVKIRGGRVSPIVARNRALPCVEQRPFATPRSDQEALVFEVYQGESELARENIYVGRFRLHGLGEGRQHFVRFDVDQRGLLSVSASEEGKSRREYPAEMMLSSGLTPAECESIAASLSGAIDLETALARSVGASETGAPVILDSTPAPKSKSVMPPPSEDAPPSSRSYRPRRPTLRTDAGVVTLNGMDPPTIPSHRDPSRDRLTTPASTVPLAGDSIIGSTIAGRYKVDAVLGEGGMGRVYRASHHILDRQFAVKVLHPELSSNDILVKRFMREAQSAARIDSDYVIDILDFGELEDGTSYFVMEFLEGVTLGEELLLGALPIDRLKDIAMQISKGLAAAHKLGIVHRDLKPNNITLVDRGDRPLVKILDFGIAKSPTSDGQALTLVNSIVGTPHYMAPEQIFGVVDGRTDIYALGIVMYEMATGEVPFDEESVALLLSKQRNETPDPPSRHPGGEDCPPELDAIIMKCLEKEKDKRFQTAEEVTQALLGVPIGPEYNPSERLS